MARVKGAVNAKKKHKKILDKPDEDLYNKKDKVMKAR